jgi:hydroxymethylglutaryl-CoA lyase
MALDAGARNIVLLASATETHSAKNLGRSVERVLSDLESTAAAAHDAGLRMRLAISMAWIDPVEGKVPAKRVVEICARSRALGIGEITLCDTYGGASPRAVFELLEEVFALYPPEAVGLHLHDTFGGASACALVGLCLGVRRFDASIAGLGGCPFAEGAKGNMATEDLNRLLRGLGLETGINEVLLGEAIRDCLLSVGRAAQEERQRCPNR